MLTAKTHQVSGFAIVLAAGLYALAVGEAVFLLAALILPPTAVQNDATFFVYGMLGMVFVFTGSLLVSGGLIGLKGAHWLVVLGVLLVAVFAAYGFHWPDWLLPSVDSPFRPFTGQFTLGGIMLVLFLVVLLSRWQGIWPVLWRPLLVASAAAAVTIALLVWLFSVVPYTRRGGRALAPIRPGNADEPIMDCTFVTWIVDGARGADNEV